MSEALFNLQEFTDPDAPARAALDAIMPPGIWKGQPRPDGHHEIVKRIVVERIMPEILAWLDEESEPDREALAGDLMKVVSGWDDGFEIAKKLERRFHWDGNSSLVDILDGLDFYGAHGAALIRWIEENGIVPRLEVGAQVKVHRTDAAIHDGEIRAIDAKRGTYTVMIPALGHVREGLGTHGSILDWDEVEALNPEAAHA